MFKKVLKGKNRIVAIVTLALLFGVVGSFGAYAATSNNNDKVSDENVVTEKNGGSSLADESNSIFLDSYHEQTYSEILETEENLNTEDIGGFSTDNDSNSIFLESSSINDASIQSNIGIFATYNINWSVSANTNVYGVSQLSMAKGNKVSYNIDWTPEPGTIRVGLYNRNTGKYYWADSDTNPPLEGKITVPSDGLYSFAVGNTTDTDVTVTGSFEY